jgi:hypothetical protein
MTTTKKPTKAQALAGVQALIAGLQKHFPNAQFTLGNAVYTTDALVQLLTGLAAAMTAQQTAETAAKDALTKLDATHAQAAPVIQDLKDMLHVQFGQAAGTLADFGLAPRKVRTPMTVEQKAAAKAKRDATRAAKKAGAAGATTATQTTATSPAGSTPAATNPAPAKPAS